VRRAIAERRLAAVQLKIGIEVVSHFQAGFCQAGKSPAVGQQLGFQGAPAHFRLRVVVGIAWPGVAGQRPGVGDALPAGPTGVLTAPVGVDNQGWRSVKAYSKAVSTNSVGIYATKCQPTIRRENALLAFGRHRAR
jgi:hypothetical protein